METIKYELQVKLINQNFLTYKIIKLIFFRTQIASIRALLINENKEKSLKETLSLTPADEMAEFSRCSSLNDEWNAEIAKMREIRLAKENERRKTEILATLDSKEKEVLLLKESMNKKILAEKENSKSFITEKNLQQAIEQALANPISFLYAINSQGERVDKAKKDAPPPSTTTTTAAAESNN